MTRTGRPSNYTVEIAQVVCDRLAGGESLVRICEDADMPGRSTIFQWLFKHKEFADNYARAREAWADAEFERMMQIADNPEFGTKVKTFADGTEETVTGDMVDHRKLQIDTRKWALERMNKGRYGQHSKLDAKLSGGVTLQVVTGVPTKADEDLSELC